MSASDSDKDHEDIYVPCSKRQRLYDYSPELFSSPGGRTVSDASGLPIFPSNSTECATSESYTIDPSFFSREKCGGDGEVNPAISHTESEDESQSSSIDAIYPSDISSLRENNSESEGADTTVFQCLDTTALPKSERDDELHEVGTILVSRCCIRSCLFHLTAHDVIKARKKFSSLGVNAKRQWLMDRIHENSHETEQGILDTKYTVAGREICQLAWCKVHAVSPTRVRRMLKSVSFGQIIAEHGNKGNRRVNTKSENAKAWMQRYFHLVGDNIPKKELVCLSMFYRIWNENFPNVVIPEVRQLIKGMFARCKQLV